MKKNDEPIEERQSKSSFKIVERLFDQIQLSKFEYWDKKRRKKEEDKDKPDKTAKIWKFSQRNRQSETSLK